jgi:hypothetical protein
MMRNLLLLILLSGCAGPNVSSTGAVWTDYLPSFFMLAGAAILVYAGVTYYKGTLTARSDAGKSKKSTGIILAVAGGAVFIFGLATYFW